MLERLLLSVSLPLVSWSSHVTFDLVPETGNRGAGTLAAFPTAAGGWSSTYYDDARGRLIAGCNIGCASGRPVSGSFRPAPNTMFAIAMESAARSGAVTDPMNALSLYFRWLYTMSRCRLLTGRSTGSQMVPPEWCNELDM